MSLQLVFVQDGKYPSDCILDPDVALVTAHGLVLDSKSVELVRDIESGVLDVKAKTVQTNTGLIGLHQVSTGCKVALLINSGLKVSMRECGVNAVYEILHHCTKGTGYFEPLADVPTGPCGKTDAVLNGIHYDCLWELAEEMFIC